MISTLYFILGLIIGSFGNVLVFREETGEKITGRSHCRHCNRTLSWFELIPLVSFIVLLGKCRTCNTPISLQYPLVELTTGLLFLGVSFLSLEPVRSALLMAGLALLVVMVTYDLRHTILPNTFVYSFNALAFLSVFVLSEGVAFPSILAFASGPLLALPFLLLWAVSGGRWIGLGDAKLALGMGWFLGITEGYSAIILAFWIGALVSLILLALPLLSSRIVPTLFPTTALPGDTKPLTMKSEVPFAPFLAIGFCIVLFTSFNVFTLTAPVWWSLELY